MTFFSRKGVHGNVKKKKLFLVETSCIGGGGRIVQKVEQGFFFFFCLDLLFWARAKTRKRNAGFLLHFSLSITTKEKGRKAMESVTSINEACVIVSLTLLLRWDKQVFFCNNCLFHNYTVT